MFPKQQWSKPNKQRGAALAGVIFIIVVMALIGAALVRLLSSGSSAVVSEVSGSRAYHAAQSALQLTLTDLFPLNSNTANTSLCSARVVGNPEPLLATYAFSAPGLASCSADVYCDQLALNPPFQGYHFRLRAEGVCTVGSETYSREILVEASDGTF